MTTADISVLLCTYNRAGLLQDILEQLIVQETFGEFNYEIVVVDNASVDETKSVVERVKDRTEIPIRYILENRAGVHQARNRSLKEGRGRWFAFIDDDELPEPDWLAKLYRAAQETRAKILGGSVHLALDDEQLNSLGPEFRASLRERRGSGSGDRIAPFIPGSFPGTDNLMVDRKVTEVVGEFDESMTMGGADFDFMIRAKKAGFDAWFVPNSIVHHRIPPKRLTAAFIKNDSFQSGVMLALLRFRYHGWFMMAAEMVARIGQTAIITLPMMAKSSLFKHRADVLDRKIKWWRTIGFSRYALLTTFPWFPKSQKFLDDLDFRKGRSITS